MTRPRCIVIAVPNGAGKTTFAREFLLKDAGVVHFVNADLIAGGLSPLRPESAAVAAGRLYLKELDRLAKARVDFAFETTLSGLVYLGRLRRWKAAGYRIEIIFLRLSSPRLALRRIAGGSSRVDTTFPAPMCCAVSRGAGLIFKRPTARWPTRGRSMIIPEKHFSYRREHYEKTSP